MDLLILCLCSVRNNGRTSDIYRPNEAFVRPFVISPDILCGGVAAGVEFCMSNPHSCTFQCHVNRRSFRQFAHETNANSHASYVYVLYCTERVFCQILDVGAQVHTLGLRGAQQNAADSHGPYTVNAAG